MAALAESNRQAALEKSYIQDNSLRLKNQIENIANYIAEQSSFLFSLKNSISRQTKLHAQLLNKLSQLDPSSTAGGKKIIFACPYFFVSIYAAQLCLNASLIALPDLRLTPLLLDYLGFTLLTSLIIYSLSFT